MRERINTIPATKPMGYRQRLEVLRERKLEDTKDKATYQPFSNSDDYGAIMPPGDFEFIPYSNHPDGGYYGYDGFSKNFHKLMCEHPVFIDPCDAFPNRWMNCLTWLRGGRSFNPEYSYDHLKPGQELYGITPGIGADAHFGGD